MNGASAALSPDQDPSWQHDMGRAVGHFVRNFQSAARALPSKASNDFPREYSDVSQPSSPSYAPKHGEKVGDMHPSTSGRTVLGLCKNEVRDKIATALRAVPSAKHIARDTAEAGHPLSTDSAENLRSGINIPNGFNLILLARLYPELRAVVRQLIDSDFDQDPKAYALFIATMQYAQGRVK